jgi:tRNA threonylcarbamoyladenosine biosynthesis protein TsaE
MFRSYSSEETKILGAEIAKKISKRKEGALVIALRGDLGAGKTTFVQGFFRGLGIKRNPISPTFVIMRRYKIFTRRFADIYHFDAYRLKKAEDIAVLEFEKILSNPKNIVLIEWPEKIEEALPRGTMRLDFIHGKKENERVIKIKPGSRLEPVLSAGEGSE